MGTLHEVLCNLWQYHSEFYVERETLQTKVAERIKHTYEGWNFNSGNYLFTTDTK